MHAITTSLSFSFEPMPNPRNSRELMMLDPIPLFLIIRLGNGDEGGVGEDEDGGVL